MEEVVDADDAWMMYGVGLAITVGLKVGNTDEWAQ